MKDFCGKFTVPALTLIISGTCLAQTTICMRPPSQASAAVGSLPYRACTGDFNNDGKTDIVTLHPLDNFFSVLVGNGDGTFGTAKTQTISSSPRDVVSGDFDGDGNADLAVALNNGLVIMRGQGTGNFIQAYTRTFGQYIFALSAARLNTDAYDDLALVDTHAGEVHVMLGTGTGSFSAGPVAKVDSIPYGIVTGDFNGDGYTDLATADYGDTSEGLTILNADGAGNFTRSNINVGYVCTNLVSGDFNSDGKSDIAAGRNGYLKVYLGHATGFNSAGSYSVPYMNQGVTSADYNSDGLPDLASVSYAMNNITVFPGQGNGTFSSPTEYPVGKGPTDILSDDFNNDGQADLAVVNYNNESVSLLLNDIPRISVTGPTIMCVGESATIYASGASSYTWNAWNQSGSMLVAPTANSAYTVTGTSPNGCTGSGRFEVVISACTGLDKNVTEFITIGPNPSDGEFTLYGITGRTYITVYDLNGRALTKKEAVSDCAFDLRSCANGIYVAELTDGKTVVRHKVIIQHAVR